MIKKITEQEMSNIVHVWCDDAELAPKGLFYCEENGVWIGCDNSTGDCIVEEFKTEEDVMKWLNYEFVYDVHGFPLNV
jgi:hypothetical protein